MRALAGWTAFITGSASGIGLGMAQAFLDRGMKAVIGDLLQAHLDEARGTLTASPVEAGEFVLQGIATTRSMFLPHPNSAPE